MRSGTSKPAFTLVEILIVVLILSILAAIVVPRYLVATETATGSNIKVQLFTMRRQIDLWKLHHNDNYPTLAQLQQGANDWDVLTNRTDDSGTVDAAGEHGPYVITPPDNPLTGSSLVVAAGAPVATAGWTYNQATGALKVILPADVDPVGLELAANDYEQVGG